MLGWIDDIEDVTLNNETFRTVIYTGQHCQLVVMSLKPGEEIGYEVHPDHDQFIRVEQGTARVALGTTQEEISEEHTAEADWAVIVPAGTWHNVMNTGTGELKLYTIYAPAHHPPGTVHRTKVEADAAEAAES
jgi:mannose-6-phosphate isomerase-like protein (cupin superfamily)